MARGAAAAVVAVFLLAPGVRGEAWLSLVALPLGYGHLIGAARGRPMQTWLALLCGFAAYTWVLQSPALAGVLLPCLLLISAWHIVENDLALARCRATDHSLPPLRSAPAELMRVAAGTSAIALAALATPEGRQWCLVHVGHALPARAGFGLAEVAAAVLLYHALSFLGFALRRPRLWRRLVLSHVVPLVANALLYFWMDALYAIVAAPTLFLFWSAAHAVETGRRRYR